MKTQVDIITGFLGSGKTRFINRLIQTNVLDFKHAAILQCEFGQTEIEPNGNVQIVRNEGMSHPDHAFLLNFLQTSAPDRLIIESNGMKPTTALIQILESKEFQKICMI